MRAARTSSWSVAGLVVLTGHAAAALWIAQTRVEPLPTLGDPIFIELAPPPPAPDLAVPDSGLELSGPVTGLPEPSPPDLPVPPSPVPPTHVADPSPARPLIETPPLQPLPIFDAAALLSSQVSDERPIPRPALRREAPPEKPSASQKPRTEPTPERERKRAHAAPPPPGPSSSASAKSTRSAGQVRASAQSVAPKAEASWRSKASSVVARHMQRGRYSTRGPVSATISLTVDGGGRITGAAASSGGGADLEAALARQIRRLGRLPAPPAGQPISVVVPVRIAH